ncbi:hypothetical protein EJB05_21166, partial [Eragrostis curvula]
MLINVVPMLRHVVFLQSPADSRLQPFLHLRSRGRRWGWIVESSLNSKSHEQSQCDIVLGERRQKNTKMISLKDEPKDNQEMIGAIRKTLRSMGSGEISVSAYDTAWVALVKNLDSGGDGPQFPSSIKWIAQNQLPDGSWGDNNFFLVQDRIINTLACVIALKSWNVVHEDQCKKGLSFIHENLWRLPEDDEDWMLAGFETIFPMLLDMAKDLGLDMACDEPILLTICAKRDLKLAKIPRDVLHSVPSALLLSLEGMPNLDWQKIFKLQSPDGSFMSSAAPTAYALMQTSDRKCLEFLDTIVTKFNGGVPFVYPVEMYERLWAVDRLERLGISYYFRSEIESCLDYAYSHWTQEGLGFTRNCAVNDIDDTSMAFRLLRLHGYNVSPCVFKHFEKDGEFVCYPGESNHSVSAMYNLYRAADQATFPGDDGVLRRAKTYCRAFLRDRRASGQLRDKWIISKGLPGEVAYALDFPWKASLPRIETRMYLEQYGGSANVWIGKVLHRMHLFNNDLFLKLAKADFSSFQRLCRSEWHGLKRWCEKNNLDIYGVTPESALRQTSWNQTEQQSASHGRTHTAVLAEAISSYLWSNNGYTDGMREQLVSELIGCGDNEARFEQALEFKCKRSDSGANDLAENGLVHALNELIDLVASDDFSNTLREAWQEWLMARIPKESHESCGGDTSLLLIRTIEICSGRHGSYKQNLNLSEYSHLEKLIFSICCKLSRRDQNGESMGNNKKLAQQLDSEMEELVAQCVLQSSNAVNRLTKQTFLHVAKSYYYVAHCSPETIDNHIAKVIFECVV